MVACYRDSTFCAIAMNGCKNTLCTRFLSEEEIKDIMANPKNSGIAFSDFSPNCEFYAPPTDKETN